MARQFQDLGFCLPSVFLTDQDLLTEFKSDRLKTSILHDFNSSWNSFGFNSALSSPGEMVTSPTEIESEDDDLVTEFTRKLAHSNLDTSFFSSHHTSKGCKLSGSPQSTLCRCQLRSTGSPNSVSGVFFPPDAEDYLRLDYIYAAAEEASRMRMIEETTAFYKTNLLPQVKSSPSPSPGFYPRQARSINHISSQFLQAEKPQQQQMMKKAFHGSRATEFQLQNGRRNCGDGRGHVLSMTAWPGLKEPRSGTRDVFLGASMPKKERTGTGVFLPKRFCSSPADTRKKSGCPTVLLPEKMVHAFNLDAESIGAHIHHSRDYGTSNFDHDIAAAALKHRNIVMMAAQQRRNLAMQPATNQQSSLPQDWTY